METTPDTLLRRAVHHHLPSLEIRDADIRMTPAGIEWSPKGLRMVRAYLSHDATGSIRPHAASWRLYLVWNLPPMRGRDERTRAQSNWWDDAPDAADIAALIREVL